MLEKNTGTTLNTWLNRLLTFAIVACMMTSLSSMCAAPAIAVASDTVSLPVSLIINPGIVHGLTVVDDPMIGIVSPIMTANQLRAMAIAKTAVDTAEPMVALTPAVAPEPPAFKLREHFGEASIIDPGGVQLTMQTLPNAYYPGINYSYFKAWMPYTALGRNNQCGKIAYSDRAYTDENGLRRYSLAPGEFTTSGQADYLVAMATFYKPKGTVGQRFLVVTPNGSYTVRTSDELSDAHSDRNHMFSWHGEYACLLEFLIDKPQLAKPARQMGTVSALGGLLSDEITHLYLIG